MIGVTIVTFNSRRVIAACLNYLLQQDCESMQIVVVDNASSDGTKKELQRFEGRKVRIVYNAVNVGFAAGQNQAIALCRADWVLTLNPDVRLSRNFLSELVQAGEADPSIGSVCGKLLAMSENFELPLKAVFDSTGIYFTPNLRHLDRGSRMPDEGQYDRPEFVFGATGAACLYRRKMIEDVSINGEFFDADFFAYREDADVAWRAQLLGWKCLYTPAAAAYHVRSVVPENRRSLPAVINMHSVKNRWLMRIKNMTAGLYRRHWFAITVRDAVVIAGCLLREFSSLRAFPMVVKTFHRTWQKRRLIMRKKRVSDDYLASWFAFSPMSYPAPLPAAESHGTGDRIER